MATTLNAGAKSAYDARYIRLNPSDNVAIVVNDFGLKAGTVFPCGLTLKSYVPQGHKTALSDIGKGRRFYGTVR